MKVGDLVVQQIDIGLTRVGVVTRVAAESALIEPPVLVTVQWPTGEDYMYRSELKVISESR